MTDEPDAEPHDDASDSPARDIQEELKDYRATTRQRALLHQFMVDAAALFSAGGSGYTLAATGVQNSGANIHIGDVHVGRRSGAAAVLATGPVDPEFLRRAVASFVPPGCYPSLCDLVRQRRVAVVLAPRGIGATTLALNALRATSGAVRKLDPDVDLPRIDVAKLAPGAGYLVEAPPLGRLRQWRDFHLDVLTERFADADVRLIITSSSMEASGFGRYSIRADSPPLAEVLEAHVRLLRGGELDTAAADLIATVVGEGLLAALEANTRVEHVVELAIAISRILAGETSLAEVRSTVDLRSAERFADWFASQESLEQQALVIALAVLHGLAWEWVLAAAKRLVGLVPQPEAAASDSPAVLLANGQSRQLQLARAELVPADQPTDYGRLTVTTARFTDESWPFRVIEHVWREYPDAHERLLQWLRGFAESPHPEERVRAAAAVGLASCYSFEQVLTAALLPWADSENAAERLMAATALSIPGIDQDHSPVVAAMLRDWSRPASPPHRRWTAARAMGLGLGLVNPPQALPVLANVASTDSWLLIRAVVDSVMEMFVEGDDSLRSRLLDRLIIWLDPAGRQVRLLAGQSCFLRLADDTRVTPAGGRAEWPALLWLADRDPADRDRIATLWRAVLWTPKVGRPARAVLYEWVRQASDNTDQVAPLADLVARSAVSSWQRDLRAYHLRRWRSSEARLARVVDEIEAMCDRRDGDNHGD